MWKTTDESIDPNRLVLCIWYLADQEGFYKDYYDRFTSLTEFWLNNRTSLLKQRVPVRDILPDMCGGCLSEGISTIGGRVRTVCPECYTVPWSGTYLRYDYRYKMAEILNVTETVLESYLALALWYKKYAGTGPQTKSGPLTISKENTSEQSSRPTDARTS